MKLEELGYNVTIEKLRIDNGLMDFEIGRVLSEHKERYIVHTGKGVVDAEITGHLRYSAKSREDFPAVGDWVALVNYDADFAIIHSVLPRLSVISRQAVGKFGEKQLIATNIDSALIIQAIDRDLNINRIERYLTICHASKVNPIIILTKTDLIDKQRLKEIVENVNVRIHDIPVFAISNETQEGFNALEEIIEKGKTYCLLGSSGVGKSSLLNNLKGETVMKTDLISEHTNRGRHITSHRELIVLDNGGILIDNPGMREVGITDATEGLEVTFDKIYQLSVHCKYKDCTHTNELGCSVIEAVEKGTIDAKTYENYLKMEREKEHFELSVSEKRKKEKAFAKMVKNFKNDIPKISHKHKK